MCRTGPPSPALPLSMLSLCVALRGFHAAPCFPGPSRLSWFISALRMQKRRHLLQVFAGMQLSFDLGDIGQSLSGLQECLLDVVKMLNLMFNQAGTKST